MSPKRFPAIVCAAVLVLAASACGSSAPHAPRTTLVRVGDAVVTAEVAADHAARTRGLSGRAGLGPNRGLLFTYPDRARRTFWMSGMRFPIDIVWIDRGRVTGVEHDVPVPETGLPTYSSDAPADRVLEVSAGWAARHRVRAGDRVVVGTS